MNYWIVKTEPEEYSWDDLVREKVGHWTGVRNYRARNFLKEWKKSDRVFIYHSGDKEIVGEARVVRSAYPDPTTKETGWVACDLFPVKKFIHPVSLGVLKTNATLSSMLMVKIQRLSVSPISPEQYQAILSLGKGSEMNRRKREG